MVQASVALFTNYNCNMFKVQATEFKSLGATADKWGENEKC